MVIPLISFYNRVCSGGQENLSLINENGKDFHFFSSPQRQKLRRQWRNKKVEGLETNQKTFPKTLWEKSQHSNIKDEYYVEAFIKYNKIKSACQTLLDVHTNILTSPNHSNTTNCTWLITSNFGSYIILNFKFIEVYYKTRIAIFVYIKN